MIDLLNRYFSFRWRKNRFLFVFQSIAIVVLVVGIVLWTVRLEKGNDIVINLLASFFGFLFGALLVYIIVNALAKHEDERKVCYDDYELLKQYNKKYWHTFKIHKGSNLDIKQCENRRVTNEKGSFLSESFHWLKMKINRAWYHLINFRTSSVATKDEARVLAEKLFVGTDEWELKDRKNEQFELDSSIMSQYEGIMAAHRRSLHKATLTIRLQDCKKKDDGTIHIETIRSTYLAHLLTNRAIDYKINGSYSLREAYENRDKLVPLPKSKMSNHIGVNALVFLPGEVNGKKENHKYLLLPERSLNGTIAKGMLTASMATMLKMEDMEADLTKEYLERDAVLNYLPEYLGVSNDWLEKSGRPTVNFLGASRDVYEGGKPTFFYQVDLRSSVDDYMKARYDHKKNSKTDEMDVDAVAHMHVVLWKTVRMNPHDISDRLKDKLSYSALRHYKYWIRSVEMVRACEKNLITAFWFLNGCK